MPQRIKQASVGRQPHDSHESFKSSRNHGAYAPMLALVFWVNLMFAVGVGVVTVGEGDVSFFS